MFASITSVVIGYLAMALIVMIGTIAAAAAMIPGGISGAKELEGPPPRNYLFANLAVSFVAALAGGWGTARTAPFNPVLHTAALAAVMLVLSLISAKTQARRQPSWYPYAIAVIGLAGVCIGAGWEIWSSMS